MAANQRLSNAPNEQSTPAPLISVILPTYNRAHILPRSIASVLQQSFADFELIIVDDSSTDNTREIIGQIPDKRIVPLFLDKNLGVAGARNAGIEIARGEYIAFQDSDDEWNHQKLEKQIHAFRYAKPGADVVFCGFLRHEPGRQVYLPGSRKSKYEGQIYPSLLAHNFVSPQTAIIKRQCLDKLDHGFDHSLSPLEDWDYFLRLARNGCCFALVNEPLVLSQLNNDSISADSDKMLSSHRLLINKHIPFLLDQPKLIKRLKRSLSATYYVLGLNLAAQRKKTEAKKYFNLALKRSPFTFSYLASSILSLLDPIYWLRILSLKKYY